MVEQVTYVLSSCSQTVPNHSLREALSAKKPNFEGIAEQGRECSDQMHGRVSKPYTASSVQSLPTGGDRLFSLWGTAAWSLSFLRCFLLACAQAYGYCNF